MTGFSRTPLLATYLANQLITKTAVFIGYSLEDPDFRQIWHVVSDRLGRTRRKAYAIAVNARPADVARYERRGVKVINLPGTREKYGDVLAATLRELREYLRDNVISVSKVTEEERTRRTLPRERHRPIRRRVRGRRLEHGTTAIGGLRDDTSCPCGSAATSTGSTS
jgi:hypothetical protein